jgi:hypothetical protein
VAQGEGPEFKPQYHKKKKNVRRLFDPLPERVLMLTFITKTAVQA